jgi:hypothetical protein
VTATQPPADNELMKLAEAARQSYGRWLLCQDEREKDARRADFDACEHRFATALTQREQAARAQERERCAKIADTLRINGVQARDGGYIAAAIATPGTPAGVWVPVSPTQEQVQAAADVYQVTSKLVGWLGPDGMYARIYRAMIAAKP